MVNECVKISFLAMLGTSQYLCANKNIINLSVENPYEKLCFPQILETLDCVHYSLNIVTSLHMATLVPG